MPFFYYFGFIFLIISFKLMFPNISSKTVQETDMEQLKSMCKKLERIQNTNLDELIKYCIGQAKLN